MVEDEVDTETGTRTLRQNRKEERVRIPYSTGMRRVDAASDHAVHEKSGEW